MPKKVTPRNATAAGNKASEQRSNTSILAAAGLALALIGLLQSQLQRAQMRGQERLTALIAEGEAVEDRIIAHLEHIKLF